MTSKISIGQRGEAVALSYLRSRGYALYAQNVQVGYGEVDLLCYDRTKRCLVFVEVKTRSRPHANFSPASNMHYRKRKNLYKAMQRWIAEHDYEGSARTDVVYVIGEKVTAHHQDIFSDF